MSGMRVLLTTDAVGGVWQYSIELARGLVALGAQPIVAILGPPPSDMQRAEAAVIRGAQWIETEWPLDWLCSDAAPVNAAGAELAKLATRLDVDIVHANMPTLLAEARFAQPVVAVTHGCVATWWAAARAAPLAPQYRWHEALTARALRRADRVIAPSRSYAECVRRHYRLPSAPATVFNGRLRLDGGGRAAPHDCALTVGRLWDEVKNAGTLDAAASRLAIPFHAAGAVRGPHGETARLEHLHVLGELGTRYLARRLARRPVFVSAARFEPFGLAVLEAAAAGCPLILSDIATFRELWDGAAIFVDPNDVDGFADAIEAVIRDAEWRAMLGSAAETRAARYVPDATASAMIAQYRRLLATQVAA